MFAWIVKGEGIVDIIKENPSDNKYLSCAYEGESDYIVSGDHHLLDIETYRGTEIFKAKSFFRCLGKRIGVRLLSQGHDMDYIAWSVD